MNRLRKIRSRAEQQRPIRAHRKDRLMRGVIQQPGRARPGDRRSQGSGNGSPRMRLVFGFKSALKDPTGTERSIWPASFSRYKTCGEEQACWSNCQTSRAMRRHQVFCSSGLLQAPASIAATEILRPEDCQSLPNGETARTEPAKPLLHRPKSSLRPRLAPWLHANPARPCSKAAIKMRRVSRSAGSL